MFDLYRAHTSSEKPCRKSLPQKHILQRMSGGDMPFIDVIEQENATDELARIYEQLTTSRGKLAEVHKIQSLHPRSITAHMNLYMEVMFAASPLKRYQREMMAVVVSQTNGCAYCQRHHLLALNHYWQDIARCEALRQDVAACSLSELDRALCVYAQQLTEVPDGQHQPLVKQLRNLGLSDRGILDAALVISYFNFVNRMVMGLGVALEADPGGYEY